MKVRNTFIDAVVGSKVVWKSQCPEDSAEHREDDSPINRTDARCFGKLCLLQDSVRSHRWETHPQARQDLNAFQSEAASRILPQGIKEWLLSLCACASGQEEEEPESPQKQLEEDSRVWHRVLRGTFHRSTEDCRGCRAVSLDVFHCLGTPGKFSAEDEDEPLARTKSVAVPVASLIFEVTVNRI